jgi:hypothetical protein
MQPDEVAAPRIGQPKPDDLLGQSLVFPCLVRKQKPPVCNKAPTCIA